MKLKSILLVTFGAFIGSSFPEAVGGAFDYVANVDYASLFEGAKEATVAAYDYCAALITGEPAA